MGPKRKPPMSNDSIDPTDSTFEDDWDKLEIKLNEWFKSSLPGLVTSIMQSHVTKIVDDYGISHRLSFKDLWLIVSTSMPPVLKLNLAHREKR